MKSDFLAYCVFSHAYRKPKRAHVVDSEPLGGAHSSNHTGHPPALVQG